MDKNKQEGFRIAIPFTCPGCGEGYVMNLVLPVPDIESLIPIEEAPEDIKNKIKYELTSEEPDAA